MALLSKGITLSRKVDGTFVALTNLQEVAELGNNAREKVDVTTLGDDAKKSIAGLADTAQDLAFKFLYEQEQFATLAALNDSAEWEVKLPDGTTATFTATPSVKLAGVGVSAPITYTLNLSVESKVVFEKKKFMTINGVMYGFTERDTNWGEWLDNHPEYASKFKRSADTGNEDFIEEIATGLLVGDNTNHSVKVTDAIIAGAAYTTR